MQNAISICNTSIRQINGLFSINDLHRAAGSEKRHQPNNWLQNQQTIDFIAECEKTGNPVIFKKQGFGTFVCKELVIHYAMWISPQFSLQVIQTFLNTIETENSGSLKPIPDKTTSLDREPLRNAVNLLVSKKGLNFSEAYKLVHQRFNVAHLDELDSEQIPQAVEYVHRVLCGEVLDKLDTPPQVQQAHIPEAALKHIAGIVRLTPRLMRYCKKHNDGLEHFTGRRDLEMYTSFLDCHAHAMELADMFHINRELWRYPAANW